MATRREISAAATQRAVSRFQWSGDHAAIENWAERILARHLGHELRMSVFMGDYRGVYVDPERLAEHGIKSRYTAPVLVECGGWIKWTGREFVVADASADAEAVQLADKLAALDDAGGHDWTYDQQARFLLSIETPAFDAGTSDGAAPVVVCPHCGDEFTAEDLFDGDVQIVCTMCAKAGREAAALGGDAR